MTEQRFSVEMTGAEGYRFDVDFGVPDLEPFSVDEPEPLGEDEGPNASRMLAAAVGHCLSASLLFCFRKARIEPEGFRTSIEGHLERNEDGRLRIGGMKVTLHPEMTEEDQGRMDRCLKLFEDFCIVTGSVREGLDVEVAVEPKTV